MRFVVSQIGAREHYAVARALHQQGRLAALVTDWYAFGRQNRKQKIESRNEEGENRNRFQLSAFKISAFDFLVSVFQRFGGASALAARCEAIPDGLVRAFPLRSLFWKWQVRRLAKQGRLYEGYAKTDSAFASAVARCHLPPHDVFFGYSYASLEMLEAEKRRGVLTVLDQIDPGAVEFRLVAEEMARFPELAGVPVPFPTEYYERNRREWELADVIVVNSEWSREALIAEGANPAKIEILPLAFELNEESRKQKAETEEQQRPECKKEKAESRKQKLEDKAENRKQKTEIINAEGQNKFPLSAFPISDLKEPLSTFQISAFPKLRVLWLGQVNVRKGIHYLMEAAKLLVNEPIYFDVVGPIGILPAAVKLAPHNVRFHGPVSRDRAAELYRQSDVFVLPTLSDGFALTQLEALAHGLPVIATPNCGRVVEDGVNGFTVPVRDAQALADAILKFATDSNLSASMAPACREAVKAFSVEAYGKRLVEIINKHEAHQS